MTRPNKEDEKYQLYELMTQENGVKSIPFDHVTYEEDLEAYCNELEGKLKEFKLDFYKKLEKKLEAIQNCDLDLQDYVEEIYLKILKYE